MHSDNREGPANRFDDAAREAYTAAMDGVQQKGVQIYERPHLWDEERPCSVMDTPTDNFIPTPTISTGEGFKSLSLAKKVAVISGLVIIGAIVLACVVSFAIENFQHLGLNF